MYVLLVFKGLRYGFASKSMVESKNLKLKLGLCGLALTSFLAINAHSTVHADTVDSGNANAITWDSDQDDSQVVKEDSNQSQPTQNAQGQAPAVQSVQSNNQKRAETSAVRVSNFDTRVVNRNNAQNARPQANVKVATVHDTAQMPVQKTKVAQFNQGSKIYTLNGSNQLSKNNGDGYVITNAGMYNGRAVDIGVTINNVQNNQGTYTTKWSNGDKADVTGRTDANFKYQDSVLLGQQGITPTVNKTRQRTDKTEVDTTIPYTVKMYNYYKLDTSTGYYPDPTQISDAQARVTQYLAQNKEATLWEALQKVSGLDVMEQDDYSELLSPDGKILEKKEPHSDPSYDVYKDEGKDLSGFDDEHETFHNDRLMEDIQKRRTANPDNPITDLMVFKGLENTGFGDDTIYDRDVEITIPPEYDKGNAPTYTWKHYTDTQVTDHLQVDRVNPANLDYNYTVGLYDAQTGDLITDLKAEYKGKAGVQATASTNVMNSAIKNKIQQINQNKATVSYTGTKANDDVAFYQETRQVNPQDKNLNRSVQRVIHINFPNGKKPASYDSITDSAGNKLTLDSNNNLTQSMSFTRTGVQNIVSGHVTYGNWQQHGAINAVTLPAIPGYTMTQTK